MTDAELWTNLFKLYNHDKGAYDAGIHSHELKEQCKTAIQDRGGRFEVMVQEYAHARTARGIEGGLESVMNFCEWLNYEMDWCA